MIQQQVDWATLKAFATARSCSLQYYEQGDTYIVFAIDGLMALRTDIQKDGDTPQTEFEATFKAAGNKKLEPRDTDFYSLQRPTPFCAADGFRFRGVGMYGTATAGTETNIVKKMTEERYINGVHMILKNHAFGDWVHFEVVDVDNVLGFGANTLLDRFGSTWYVIEDQQSQNAVLLPYPAKLLVNLYIRIVYHSVGLLDVSVQANLFTHKKT